MTTPNDSHLVSAGSGATLAAHATGAMKFETWMVADAAGNLLFDPIGCWAVSANIVPSLQPTDLISILNGAALFVDVLAAFITTDIGNTGVQGRARLRRITAHSNGALVTPQKIDSTSGALDSGVTIRKFTGSLTTTKTGEEFGAHMVYPFQPFSNAFGHAGRLFLWNHVREGVPIPCAQNEGLVITTPTDAGALSNTDAGFIFRVR